ncbi:hypothetical protein J437_LFUL014667 [Ladona fulva]|uniref:Uncharacterized protein n=1 Tax=Ladona fulva TaxID=123851 RepID=A0A8K0KFU2_LADFU|nr:hypothetical protein J437_LFUL014667 [Ladona fulva]
MSRLNENLLKSLINDLREADTVTKEILSWTGEVNSPSWKFPNRLSDTIDSAKLITDYEGSCKDKYLFTLEIIVDRLNFFLRVFLAYLEFLQGDNATPQVSPNANFPPFRSLGDLINDIWRKTKSIYFFFLEEKEKKVEDAARKHYYGKAEREKTDILDAISQTSNHSLDHCENCNISMNILKTVMSSLENMFDKINQAENPAPIETLKQSEVKKFREGTGPDLYKRTQWAAISKLAEAMTADILTIQDEVEKHLSDLAFQKQANKDQEMEVVKLQKENKKLLKNLKVMSYEKIKAENMELNRRLAAFRQDLVTVQEELDMKTCEVCIFKNKYKTELKSRKQAQTETQSVRAHIEGLEEQLITVQRNTDQLIEEWDRERRQIIAELEDIQRKLNIIKDEKDALISIIHLINEELSETENINDALKSELKAMKDDQVMLVRYPDLNDPVECELTGMPDVDVETQINANQIRIQLLEEENMRLGRTLEKYKKMRRETSV